MESQEPRSPTSDLPVELHSSPPEKGPHSPSANHQVGKSGEKAAPKEPPGVFSPAAHTQRRSSTDAPQDEVGPAAQCTATAEERAAALELEATAAKAAASWPRPGPLSFQLRAQDGRARAGLLRLPHGTVETPIFMPVGTNGALKGVHIGLLHCIDKERAAAGVPASRDVTSPERETVDDVPMKKRAETKLQQPPGWFSNLILGNTFHLYRQVGGRRMREVGKGLHRFMRWGANLLTDSGGFQMVSLCRLMDVFEEGVCFRLGPNGLKKESKRKQDQNQRKRPRAEREEMGGGEANLDQESDELVLLTPEESIFMQNQIGSDIIMQLDDVIASTTPDPQRVEDAMLRSIRWLDRCIIAHDAPDRQALFGIVQGGLDLRLRERALALFKKRDCHGTAIGGLSGGERKSDFWRVVCLCTSEDKGLPKEKPRYLMGVGYAVDLVVSVALGCDMFDCVFPCRTARFGTAITHSGSIRIKQSKFASDIGPLDPECDCYTCRSYSRAFLHSTFNKSPTTGQLLTLHNLYYMEQLCSDMRRSIKEKRFSEFVCDFLQKLYPRQTCSEGEMKTDNAQPTSKRRRVANTGILQEESANTAGNADSLKCTKHNARDIDSDAHPGSMKGKLNSSEGPRPPEWVRDALLAAGIDIRHLYTHFDPKE